MDSVNESLEDLVNYEEDRNRSSRVRRSECPGGSGKFGFNSYNLLAFLLMSFNQVRISVYRFNVFGLFVQYISRDASEKKPVSCFYVSLETLKIKMKWKILKIKK